MRIPLAFLMMAFLSVPAFAAEAPGKDTGAQPRVCRDDMKKFCGQVKPGEGRIAHCIKENEKSFSPACQAELEKQRTERAAKLKTCHADIEKFCKGKQDSSGGVVRCLREHEQELSEGCRNSLHKRAAGGARK